MKVRRKLRVFLFCLFSLLWVCLPSRAQQSSSQTVQLNGSGQTIALPNSLTNTTTLSVQYVITGAPATVTLVVEGQTSLGIINILDTYSTVANTTRSISLSGVTYTSFILAPLWTGGTNVSVTATVVSSGSGSTTTLPYAVTPVLTVFAGAASGACAANGLGVNTSNGNLYTCSALAWVAVGGGGGSAWNTLTSGTNTVMAAVMGTGSSLTFSGTGSINASAINGVTVSGTAANTNCIVASSSSAAAWGSCGASFAFPITVSGTTTSTGFPYFSNTTTLSTAGANLTWVSPTLTIGVAGATTGILTLGSVTATGSVSLTPASSASAFTATLPGNTGTLAELNLIETFSAVQTISAANGLVLSAMSGTACLDEVSGVVTSTGAACASGVWSGITNPSGNLDLTMASNLSEFDTTTALANFFSFRNTTAAVVGTSQGSPVISTCGTAFHGSASVLDCMTFSELPGNGNDAAIVQTIGHTGTSTGAVSITLPQITVVGTILNATLLTFSSGNSGTVQTQSGQPIKILSGSNAGSNPAGALQLFGGPSSTAAANGGNALVEPGGNSAAAGIQGILVHTVPMLKGATVTVNNLQCNSSDMTTADCGASPVDGVIGVAIGNVSASPINVQAYGEVLINSSSTATVGQNACAGSTGGQVTPSSSACTNGTKIGVVVSVSANYGASGTLPLVLLQIGG